MNQPGSLCNLRDYINCKLVDKVGKTFSITDEFILHAFKAHPIAAICEELNLDGPNGAIPHEASFQWLRGLASSIVERRIMPTDINSLHQDISVLWIYVYRSAEGNS